MFHTKVVEKIKTDISCPITSPHPQKNNKIFVYEIKWNNTVEPGRPQMKIWHKHISCWLAKAPTHTHNM